MKKLSSAPTLSLSQSSASKPLKFIVVGAWNTALGYAAFVALERLFHRQGTHYLVALVLSQVVIIANAYLCYKFFVFKTQEATFAEPTRFLFIYGLNFVINFAALPILVNVVRMTPVVAQGLIVVVLATANYFGHNIYTFRQAESPQSQHDQGAVPYEHT